MTTDNSKPWGDPHCLIGAVSFLASDPASRDIGMEPATAPDRPSLVAIATNIADSPALPPHDRLKWRPYAYYASNRHHHPASEAVLQASDAYAQVLAELTNDLDAMPLTSPAYYARHNPEQYEAGHCWYVRFVCAGRPSVFPHMVAAMYPRVTAGVVAMDFCAVQEGQGLPGNPLGMLTRPHGDTVRGGRVDMQTTHLFRIDGRDVR